MIRLAPESTTSTHAESSTQPVRVADWSMGVAVGLIALVGVIVVIRDRSWLPVSDLAILEMQVRALAQEPAFVGSYSRFGWNHPGPMFFYLMWGPWRLTGGNGFGLLLGMLLLQLAAVGISWLAARAVSTAAAVLVTTGLLIVWASGAPGEALAPWNPQVGLILGGAVVVLAWNAAVRGKAGGLLLLPVATILVQGHVGAVVLVSAVCATGVVAAGIGWGQVRDVPWRAWLASAAVTAAMWALPLWEQVRPGGGNLTAIVTSDPGPGLGLGRAFRVVADAFATVPYWWSPTLGFLPDQWGWPVWASLPLAAVVVAIHRRDAVHLRALAVAAAAGAAAVLSVWRVAEPYSYLVAWLPAVAVTIVALSAWVLIDSFGWGSRVAWFAPVLLGLSAVGVAVNLLTNSAPFNDRAPRIQAVLDVVADREIGSAGVHLVARPLTGTNTLEWLVAVANELERRGIEVSADLPAEWPTSLAGLIATDAGTRTPVMVRVLDGPAHRPPPGWQAVATDDPFTPAEWIELSRLRAVVADPAASDDERWAAGLAVADITAGREAWQILVPSDGKQERHPSRIAGSIPR